MQKSVPIRHNCLAPSCIPSYYDNVLWQSRHTMQELVLRLMAPVVNVDKNKPFIAYIYVYSVRIVRRRGHSMPKAHVLCVPTKATRSSLQCRFRIQPQVCGAGKLSFHCTRGISTVDTHWPGGGAYTYCLFNPIFTVTDQLIFPRSLARSVITGRRRRRRVVAFSNATQHRPTDRPTATVLPLWRRRLFLPTAKP